MTEREPWVDRAACKNAPKSIIFGTTYNARQTVIDTYCAVCPVVAECLTDAENHPDDRHYVRGGQHPTDHRRIKYRHCQICDTRFQVTHPSSQQITCNNPKCLLERKRRSGVECRARGPV